MLRVIRKIIPESVFVSHQASRNVVDFAHNLSELQSFLSLFRQGLITFSYTAEQLLGSGQTRLFPCPPDVLETYCGHRGKEFLGLYLVLFGSGAIRFMVWYKGATDAETTLDFLGDSAPWNGEEGRITPPFTNNDMGRIYVTWEMDRRHGVKVFVWYHPEHGEEIFPQWKSPPARVWVVPGKEDHPAGITGGRTEANEYCFKDVGQGWWITCKLPGYHESTPAISSRVAQAWRRGQQGVENYELRPPAECELSEPLQAGVAVISPLGDRKIFGVSGDQLLEWDLANQKTTCEGLPLVFPATAMEVVHTAAAPGQKLYGDQLLLISTLNHELYIKDIKNGILDSHQVPDTYHMPDTILQILPAASPGHWLSVCQNGRITAMRVRTWEHVQGIILKRCQELAGLNQWSWIEINKIFESLQYKNSDVAPLSLDFVQIFHELWRRVINEINHPDQFSMPQQTWLSLLDWARQQSRTQPALVCALCRQLIEASLSYPQYHQLSQEKIDAVRPLLNKTVTLLFELGQENSQSWFWQRQGQVRKLVAKGVLDACPWPQPLESLPTMQTLRDDLWFIRKVDSNLHVLLDKPILRLYAVPSSDLVCAVTDNSIELICHTLKTEELVAEPLPVLFVAGNMGALRGNPRILQPLPQHHWLLVTSYGEVGLFYWDGVGRPGSLIRLSHSFLQGFHCHAVWYDDGEAKRIYLGGCDQSGMTMILHCQLVLPKSHSGVFRDTVGEVIFHPPWRSTKPGAVVEFAATNSFIYAVDQKGQCLWRAGRYHLGPRHFEVWVSLQCGPCTVRTQASQGDAPGKSLPSWYIIIGDEQSRLLTFRENLNVVDKEPYSPVLIRYFLLPSELLGLTVLPPQSNGVSSRRNPALLVVGTSRDGVFIMDLETGLILGTQPHICPPESSIVVDGKRLLIGTIRGELWTMTIASPPSQSGLQENQSISRQEMICQQHMAGKKLLSKLNSTPIEELERQLNALPNFSHAKLWENGRQAPTFSPLNYYVATLVGSLFCKPADYWSLSESSNSPALFPELLGKYIRNWLVGQQGEMQIVTVTAIREIMNREKDQQRYPMLDLGLAKWLEDLQKLLILEVKHKRARKWCPILRPLINTMLGVAVHQRGQHCCQAIRDWLDAEIDHPQWQRVHKIHMTLQGLMILAPDNLDDLRRLGFCLDQMADIFGEEHRVEEMLRDYRQRVKQEEPGISHFWPQHVWQLWDLLASGETTPEFHNRISEWVQLFKKEQRDTLGLALLFSHLVVLFSGKVPITRYVAAAKSFRDAANNKNATPYFSPELCHWFANLSTCMVTLEKYRTEQLRVQEMKEGLDTMREVLTKGSGIMALTLIEKKIRSLLFQHVHRLLDELEQNCRVALPDLIAADHEQVVRFSLKLEVWRGETGEVEVAVRNHWPWNLEITTGRPTVSPFPSLLRLQPREQKDWKFQVNQSEIIEDRLPIPVNLSHALGAGIITAQASLPLPLSQDLDSWLKEAGIAPEIADFLLRSASLHLPLILQTVDDRLPEWRMNRLLAILAKRHNYLPEQLHWLKPGRPLTYDELLPLTDRERWIPLDIQINDTLDSQLRSHIHGAFVPRFSMLAAWLVRSFLGKSTLWKRPWSFLGNQTVLNKMRAFHEAMPPEIRAWLQCHAETLFDDPQWIFGAVSDLKMGHLLGPELWRHISPTDFYKMSALHNQERQRINNNLANYWNPGPPLEIKSILAIFRELLEFDGKAIELSDQQTVWVGRIAFARNQWEIVLLILNEGETPPWTALEPLVATNRILLLVWRKSPTGQPTPPATLARQTVFLLPERLFYVLAWPSPGRALAWCLSSQLPPSKVNPFDSRMGLKGRHNMFHGRQQLLEDLQQVLDFRKGVLIFGARRIGKTSLLQKLRHDWSSLSHPICFMDFQDAKMFPNAVELFCKRLKTSLQQIGLQSWELPNFDTSLDEWENWLRKLPPERHPILLLDEADWLFDLDFQTRESNKRGKRYHSQEYYIPLFSWLRRMGNTEDGRCLLPCILVSYRHSTGCQHALDQVIRNQNAPLYNWVEPKELLPWNDEEAGTFLTSTLADLGLYLDPELIARLTCHSLNLPWLLQEMGNQLIVRMGTKPGQVRWPTRYDVDQVIYETLLICKVEFEETIREAVATFAMQDNITTGLRVYLTDEFKYSFANILYDFAYRRAIRQPDEQEGPFTLDMLRGFMKDRFPATEKISEDDMISILDNLDRTIILNGVIGKQQWEFAYGLLPKVVRWLDQYHNGGFCD